MADKQDDMVPREAFDQVAASLRLQVAHADVVASRAKAGEAGVWNTLCEIRERAAEIDSQHPPLGPMLEALGFNCLSPEYKALKRVVLATVQYVVTGRKPEAPKPEESKP